MAQKDKKKVEIYTDGACSGNPGRGGWAAVLMYNGKSREISGGEKLTTNNRMELMAAIRALETLKTPCIVDLYSDSQYLVRAISEGWLENWKGRGWRRKDGELLNAELWQRLDERLSVHEVTFHWVKGHADNPLNERCDAIARERCDDLIQR